MIYLDNNATTLVDPLVIEAMIEELLTPPSNPSSVHFLGQQAKARIYKARSLIAAFCDVTPSEIIFTSGGTESMNLLIRGMVKQEGHIISSNIEHSCIEKTLIDLKNKGFHITFLPAEKKGYITPKQVEQAILPDTKLIVLSAVNGETGVLNDIESIGSIALKHQIPFVIDAVALLGKAPLNIPPGVSGMGFSGHKIHGPKGIGFAYLKHKSGLTPLLTGGGQEFNLRSGTENLAGIIGLAKAISLLENSFDQKVEQITFLRDQMEQNLKNAFPFITVNGEGPRICNVSNLCFPNVDTETLLMQLDMNNIAISQGSACSAGALEPSRVLLQMGLSPRLAKNSIRISLSRFTTQEEIDVFVTTLIGFIQKLL